MRIRITLLSLLFISFISCEPSEEPIIKDPIVEDPVADDEKNPELTVNGFTDVIETTTEVSISIVDDSTVETKVIYDGEELASSSEKQFDLKINPYVLPVGSTDFMVISKDAKGNETSETYTVEIKHLLMTYAFRTQSGDFIPERWLFLNDLDGKELAVIEAADGDLKIYTEEAINTDKILFTTLRYSSHTFSDQVYKDLFASTFEVALGKTRSQGTPTVQTELENTFEVVLNDVPFVNYSPDYFAWGAGYFTSAYEGDEQQTTLTIKHDSGSPIYIRTNRFGGSTPKFDGKKENYRYVRLTPPETGITSINVEASQLIPSENNIKLDIPEHDTGTLFFQRSGYENAEDLALYKNYYSIYDKDSANETVIVDYLDLPLFDQFNYYENMLSYAKNGSYYHTLGSDNNLDVNMPTWIATAQLTDTKINVDANNTEVDYYSVELKKNEYDNDGGITMTWRYGVYAEDGSTKTAPRMELPESITQSIGDTYFESTSDMEINGLTAFDYEKFNSYDQITDYLVFSQIVLEGGENKYRQVSFPNSTFSGKYSAASEPWDLDALHLYGLDEKGQVKRRQSLQNIY